MGVSLVGLIDFYNPGSQLRTPTTQAGIAWSFTATGNTAFSGKFSFASTTGNSGVTRNAWISTTLGGAAISGGSASGTSSTVINWHNGGGTFGAQLTPGASYFLNIQTVGSDVDTYRNIYTSGSPGATPTPTPAPAPVVLPQTPTPTGDVTVTVTPEAISGSSTPTTVVTPQVEGYRMRMATPKNHDAMRFWVQGELDNIQIGFASVQEEMVKLYEAITSLSNTGPGGTFVAPKGDTGPQGPQGETGATGATGAGGVVDYTEILNDEEYRWDTGWSSNRIEAELGLKADFLHTHSIYRRVFFQSLQPADDESHAGDIWVRSGYAF